MSLCRSLPSLRPLLDVNYLPLTDMRIARTFCFSNVGQAMYMTSPTEIQRITYSQETCDNLQVNTECSKILGFISDWNRTRCILHSTNFHVPGFLRRCSVSCLPLWRHQRLLTEVSSKASLVEELSLWTERISVSTDYLIWWLHIVFSSKILVSRKMEVANSFHGFLLW